VAREGDSQTEVEKRTLPLRGEHPPIDLCSGTVGKEKKMSEETTFCPICGSEKISRLGGLDSVGFYFDKFQCRTCGYKMEGHKVYLSSIDIEKELIQ